MKNSSTKGFTLVELLAAPAVARRAKGFTLVELLVVIAILALLISMIIPSLGNARRSAGAVVCISNLKQICLATVMYDDDYGAFPDGQGSADDNLREYLSGGGEVWRCPSDRGSWNYGNGTPSENGKTTFEAQKTSYRWNYYATSQRRQGGNLADQDFSLANVKNPGIYVILSANAISGVWGGNFAPDHCWHYPREMRFPVGFGDGHAAFVFDPHVLDKEPWRQSGTDACPFSPYVTRADRSLGNY